MKILDKILHAIDHDRFTTYKLKEQHYTEVRTRLATRNLSLYQNAVAQASKGGNYHDKTVRDATDALKLAHARCDIKGQLLVPKELGFFKRLSLWREAGRETLPAEALVAHYRHLESSIFTFANIGFGEARGSIMMEPEAGPIDAYFALNHEKVAKQKAPTQYPVPPRTTEFRSDEVIAAEKARNQAITKEYVAARVANPRIDLPRYGGAFAIHKAAKERARAQEPVHAPLPVVGGFAVRKENAGEARYTDNALRAGDPELARYIAPAGTKTVFGSVRLPNAVSSSDEPLHINSRDIAIEFAAIYKQYGPRAPETKAASQRLIAVGRMDVNHAWRTAERAPDAARLYANISVACVGAKRAYSASARAGDHDGYAKHAADYFLAKGARMAAFENLRDLGIKPPTLPSTLEQSLANVTPVEATPANPEESVYLSMNAV